MRLRELGLWVTRAVEGDEDDAIAPGGEPTVALRVGPTTPKHRARDWCAGRSDRNAEIAITDYLQEGNRCPLPLSLESEMSPDRRHHQNLFNWSDFTSRM